MKYATIIMALLVIIIAISGCSSKEVDTTTTTTQPSGMEDTKPIDEASQDLIDENEEIDLGDVV